jgi:hypothetical protein
MTLIICKQTHKFTKVDRTYLLCASSIIWKWSVGESSRSAIGKQ